MNAPEILFDLDHQYNLYLRRVELNELTMPPDQRIETKRAFMGGCGQVLDLLIKELTKHPEKEGLGLVATLFVQIGAFWNEQTN